jgi:hypothetical protein
VKSGRLAILLAIFISGTASEARADWLITPFFGAAFGGRTILLTFEQGAESTQLIFGGQGAWLTDGIIGFEADFAYAPRYFETDKRAGILTGSYLLTLSGNAIVTLPLSVTREALRPYVTGGIGLMDGHLSDVADVLPEITEPQERPSAAVNMGVGVIGFITRNTGARFDFRHVRSLDRDVDRLTLKRGTKLSFWRLTAGVAFRY